MGGGGGENHNRLVAGFIRRLVVFDGYVFVKSVVCTSAIRVVAGINKIYRWVTVGCAGNDQV